MDPSDVRNELIWKFADSVETVKPLAFVMENVKALGKLTKWKHVRDGFILRMNRAGYDVKKVIVNSSDFGVPQNRERTLFVGLRKDAGIDLFGFENVLSRYRMKPPTVREVLSGLPDAGTEGNILTCASKVTLAERPILRKSAYAGMYFNGLGRAINLDGVANTLPASMGGNKTPIVDQECLERRSIRNWAEEYHEGLMNKTITPSFGQAPERLRRLTVTEAAAIQTFPSDYVFCGSKSSVYTQIGNAVPCLLAEAVAKTVVDFLKGDEYRGHTVSGTLEYYAAEVIKQ
jgi:DNA (cytosine-5)-methyltransferase 1